MEEKIFLLVLQAYLCTGQFQLEKSSVIETGVVNLIVNKLPECSIVIFEDFDYHDKKSVSVLLSQLSKSLLIDTLYIKLGESTQNLENVSKSMEKFANYRKDRSFCTVALTFINNYSDQSSAKRYQTITSFKSLVKKDEDFFIFITHFSQIDQLLLSKHLGKGIKYKIGITKNPENSEIIVKSSCFFCKPGRSPITEINLDLPLHEIFKNQITNLQGSPLRVSTPLSTRWLNEMKASPDADGRWRPKRGPYALLLNLLEDRLNFTSDQFPATGGGTGGIVNGTWVGTVGDVLYGKADIGHVTAETIHRFKVVAHSFPISYEWLTFSTGIPKPFFTWTSIFRPLAGSVWPFIGVSVIIGILSFYILLKKDIRGKETIRFRIIPEYVLATLLEQDTRSPEAEVMGLGHQPSDSLRTFTIFWLLYTLLITTAYRSKLVTFLAFPNVEDPPDSFKELADSKYEIGLQYIKGAAYQVMKSSKSQIYSKIFNRMKLIESDVDCFLQSTNSKFACISWDSIAEFVKHRNLTDSNGRSPVIKSPSSTLFIAAGFVTEKRAVFKKETDDIIHWASDTGILKKLYLLDFKWIREQRQIWLTDTNQRRPDYSQNSDNADALTIYHLLGAFYLISFGLVLSTGVFCGEMIFSRVNLQVSKRSMMKTLKTDSTSSFLVTTAV